jgi:hypothetical protein
VIRSYSWRTGANWRTQGSPVPVLFKDSAHLNSPSSSIGTSFLQRQHHSIFIGRYARFYPIHAPKLTGGSFVHCAKPSRLSRSERQLHKIPTETIWAAGRRPVFFDDPERFRGYHAVREFRQLAPSVVQHIARPPELIAQHAHSLVQNSVGNIDPDISNRGVTDQQRNGSAQVQRTNVDAGIEGCAGYRARCSLRDSAMRRSISSSAFIPRAFARSCP